MVVIQLRGIVLSKTVSEIIWVMVAWLLAVLWTFPKHRVKMT